MLMKVLKYEQIQM